LKPAEKEPLPAVPPATVDPLGDRLLGLFWRRRAEKVAERTRLRVSLHLIPYLFFLYILAYLDRVNMSVAGLGMSEPPSKEGLGMGTDVLGLAFGIFFWGYWILEVPSTISVVRWGARWVFVRILVLWGICATMMGFVGLPFFSRFCSWLPTFHQDPAVNQFYVLRFLLGFFEGGFFPSVIFYLSLWFRPQDRAKAIASFMAAIPLSSVLGLPASGLLLKVHWFGLPGWRWVFIIEGIAPILAGFVTIFFLPDRPEKAKWLPPEERDWLVNELSSEERSKKVHGPAVSLPHLGLVLLLTSVYFCVNVYSYGLGSFMPKLIKSQISGLSDTAASIVAALPYFFALIAMLLNGRHSDRTGERPWHVAVPLALASGGLLAVALTDGRSVLPVAIMILWVGPFLYAHLPAFWPIPTMFLGVGAAASAIGFINMIGNLGGSLGSYMVGKIAKENNEYTFAPSILWVAPWPLLGAILILLLAYWRRRMAKPGT